MWTRRSSKHQGVLIRQPSLSSQWCVWSYQTFLLLAPTISMKQTSSDSNIDIQLHGVLMTHYTEIDSSELGMAMTTTQYFTLCPATSLFTPATHFFLWCFMPHRLPDKFRQYYKSNEAKGPQWGTECTPGKSDSSYMFLTKCWKWNLFWLTAQKA
jgi:hypothetical protein